MVKTIGSSRSAEARVYRRLYKTTRWQTLRLAQLAAEPLCRMCLSQGQVVAATVCDHIVPHRGDVSLFFEPSNLQSLCAPHHDRDKAAIERGRPLQTVGADGWPVGAGR